ncbi:lysine N(6)-hydroxylase/L-ornithine N(5)-oxygenase family protein [Streptomyces sp. WAC07149]|uniref:lysine N(6)-hydroxylase/L-ornithine N(5)-oxygenase family protein n=2 Tax=Streptomyces TaxID=1883 RepID=UPI0021AE3943|nr:lysine N(6)-hydroxylase/L-ornithine N(5)-oxygenase family protein [Streptomyces sp. WAC07149]
MLLDGTRMQIAFLKDLVTPQEPTSPYSFTNYLVAHNRLEQFLSLGTLHPTRLEYADYFAWAAAQLEHHVTYGTTAEGIRPVPAADGTITHLEIDHHDPANRLRTTAADHVSLAPGGRPLLPPGTTLDHAVFHSSTFLSGIRPFHERGRHRPYRLLVVGAGQSAAEIFRYLAREFPTATITLAHRGFALVPANNSALANAIYDPEAVDLFHAADAPRRRGILTELRTTNYGAVDDKDIQAIAELLYAQRVRGDARLKLSRFTELAACRTTDALAHVTLRDPLTGQSLTDRYDAAVLATGFDHREAADLLTGLEPHLVRDPDGELIVRRDYSVQTTPGFRPRVFLHGAAEHTHGPTSPVLSVLAHRAARILDTVFDPQQDKPADQPATLSDSLVGVDQ